MTKKELDKLNGLLDKLMQIAPCKGGPCVGYQRCVFGENGCYGSFCAIEHVQEELYSIETIGD